MKPVWIGLYMTSACCSLDWLFSSAINVHLNVLMGAAACSGAYIMKSYA